MMRSLLRSWKRFLIGALPAFVLLAGCTPTLLPKEFVNVVDKAVDKVATQGTLETWTTEFGVTAINPGIEVEAGVMYVARARLTGLAGQASQEAVGGGGDNSTVAPSDSALGAKDVLNAVKEQLPAPK